MNLSKLKAKYRELFVVEKSPEQKEKDRQRSPKKKFQDFWYGRPHEERRLGDLYVGKYRPVQAS